MRIIAFVLEHPVIERILDHIGEPDAAACGAAGAFAAAAGVRVRPDDRHQ
jgi:hypothetical protein